MTTKEKLTQNEKDALLRLIQHAQDEHLVAAEDKALIFRAKRKLEILEPHRPKQLPPKRALTQRWE